MGGFGSGRWDRCGKRFLVEQCLPLDISCLRKNDLLRPGLSYTLYWESGSCIGIRTFHEELVLFYTIYRSKDHEALLRESVFLERTPCNFGGHRYWFVCPSCGRRVAKLYGLGRHFLCRHCLNLAYSSQNEDEVDRLNRKMRKLRAKVGDEGDDVISPFPEKPKAMHWDTFDRLELMDFEADREKMRILSKEISALEVEIGELPEEATEDVLEGDRNG
jgi:hypothetical protein